MYLKKCPFCGGEAEYRSAGPNGSIECKDCGAYVEQSFAERKEKLIEMWNKREHNQYKDWGEVKGKENPNRLTTECPFCGTNGGIKTKNAYECFVECEGCRMRVLFDEDDLETTVEKWQKRVP